jgi:uncharacterized protein with PQ loop repeat
MAFAPLLQIRRMAMRQSSDDVSIAYLVILAVGFSLYLTYGLSIANRLLVITNIANIAMCACTIVVATRLRLTTPTPPTSLLD